MKKGEMSIEQRKKIGLYTSKRIKEGNFGFKKGYKPTEKHLINLSKSHLGQIPVNKGKKMGQDFSNKCRIRELGKKQSLETITKRILKLKGKKRSKEFIKNMSGENHRRYKKDRTQLAKNEKKHLDVRYKDWRKEVRKRDRNECRLSNKECSGRLETHHIYNWVDYPELRYIINNGITLCAFHHPRGREEEKRMIPIFQELLSVSEGKI